MRSRRGSGDESPPQFSVFLFAVQLAESHSMPVRPSASLSTLRTSSEVQFCCRLLLFYRCKMSTGFLVGRVSVKLFALWCTSIKSLGLRLSFVPLIQAKDGSSVHTGTACSQLLTCCLSGASRRFFRGVLGTRTPTSAHNRHHVLLF